MPSPPLYAQAPFLRKRLAQAAATDADAQKALAALDEELRREWGGVDAVPDGVAFFASNPTVSAFQSVLKAELGETSDEANAPVQSREWWKTALIRFAKFIERASDLPFIFGEDKGSEAPERPFRIANDARIALLSDWGTGGEGARKVARLVAGLKPTHVIHLGDVYPTGQRNELRDHFIGIWTEHLHPGGGNDDGRLWKTATADRERVRFWALPGNHEMYSERHLDEASGRQRPAYYLQDEGLIEWCNPNGKGQTGSFFALANDDWKIIALDTAWRDHELTKRQTRWLEEELEGDDAQNVILLSHHQLFSALDDRPVTFGKLLQQWQSLPVESRKRVKGWFWGHEHNCLIYPTDDQFRFHARGIGFGGKDVPWFADGYGRQERRPDQTWPGQPTMPRQLGRGKPGPPTQAGTPTTLAQNGFCLLEFDGPTVEIRYVAEGSADEPDGVLLGKETWRRDGGAPETFGPEENAGIEPRPDDRPARA